MSPPKRARKTRNPVKSQKKIPLFRVDGHNVKNGDITGGKRETITISIFNYKKHEGKAKTRMKLALR